MLNFLAPFKMYAIGTLVLIIAAMLTYQQLANNRLRNQRDTAISQLSDFKTAIEIQTLAREAENANKRLAGNAKMQLIQVEHEAALKQRDLDRVKSTQAIKDFYEKRLNLNHFTASERVRIEAERGRLGMSKTIETPEGLTEGRRECDATTFENLERACAITTLDFNLCRETLDADTAMVGRDE